MTFDFSGRYSEIPVLTQEGIKRYIEFGCKPGSFLFAVLCNDLMNAVRRADTDNLKALTLIVQWLDNNAFQISGSPERVKAHLESFEKIEIETVS